MRRLPSTLFLFKTGKCEQEIFFSFTPSVLLGLAGRIPLAPVATGKHLTEEEEEEAESRFLSLQHGGNGNAGGGGEGGGRTLSWKGRKWGGEKKFVPTSSSFGWRMGGWGH